MHRTHLIALALAATIAVAPAAARAHGAPAKAAVATASTVRASALSVPKFIFHAGLAFGAFHHFIYLPFKAGKFTSGSFLSKIKNYVEAGAAAVFVFHETKLALQDAQQNRVLKTLVAPLTNVIALLNTVVSKVKGHSLDAATMSTAETQVGSIESLAKGAGSPISEAIPTAKQLLAGSA
jgi:hypothetical protein